MLRLYKLTPVLFFSLLLSLLTINITGQHKTTSQGVLSFFIADSENGYGVQSQLSIEGLDKTVELETTEGGRLEFSATPGKYTITIRANGYDNLSTYFTIEKGKTIAIDAILEKTDRTPVPFTNYSSPIVEGYVVDPETGKPLSNVSVVLAEEGITVITNAEGFFTLKPTNFSVITTAEDKAIRSNFTFTKPEYQSHTIEQLLMVPDKIKLKIYLKKGQGTQREVYYQHLLDGTAKEVEEYEKNVPTDAKEDYSPGQNKSTCIIPTSIRVGINCSCTSCSNVTVMSLQYYSESGLDDEWISSWGVESLKAGSIPYRTYGGYYVNHPVKTNFDIASSTCNQVWGSTVYSKTQSAAQATLGKILTSNGINPARSEYSAENNYGGTSYNCSNGFAGGSGAYSCHNDNICSGKSPAGHGRGMCQWGSQRWATTGGKTYSWIIDHYFVTTVGYSLCGGPPPPPPSPTNLGMSQTPNCNQGATLTWTNSATNWTVEISIVSNFSSFSSKTVASGTSTTAPAGFSPAIVWQPNTIYYWRINYGTGTKNGPSFTYNRCDVTPPTTAVTVAGPWQTGDFTANFTDADETNGSGLAKSFYQVLHNNGTAWRANPNRGFFGDNFEGTSIAPIWTVQTGTWNISSTNRLEQSNTIIGNSNIYAPLTQNLSNRYLYVWNGRINGTDENRRAGFHFFCDNPSQTERGNSYLVYFRAGGNSDPNNNNKVQIYKATGNTLALKKDVSRTINVNQWYEFSVVYDRITGEIIVYIDGNIAATWIDPTPYSNGSSVSFRNGNSNYEVDNFKVYRTRYPSVTVTVGPGSATDLPYQNINPSTPAGKVKSIVMDNAGNLSTVAEQLVNVDWTKPQNLVVKDGTAADIDTFYTSTIDGNWTTAIDPHSGIVDYKVAIGSSPKSDDIVAWSNNGLNTTISNALSVIVHNKVYYISVVAKNGAGIVDTVSSDGQKYVVEVNLSVTENALTAIEIYPNPTVNQLQFNNLANETDLLIYDMVGQLVLKTKVTPAANTIDVSNFAQGAYTVLLKIGEQFIVKNLIKN